jgi:uncharacterized membrane protein
MPNRLLPALQKLSNWLVPLAALVMVFTWLYIAPPGILGKADALGYAVCHRLDERSFHVDGRQLPLCARCSGMYLGAVLGLAFQAVAGRRKGGMPPKSIIIPLVIFFVAFAVDGTNSYFYLMKAVYAGRLDFIPTLYIPNNTLRLLTGSGAGLAIAVALYPSFSQTIWRDWEPQPALAGWKSLAALAGLMLLLDLLVLPEWEWVLYPMAIISAGGILVLLTLVYAMLWMITMHQENQYTSIGQAWLPLLGGLTIALIQITAIDLFRLWLTHSWGGFPLG